MLARLDLLRGKVRTIGASVMFLLSVSDESQRAPKRGGLGIVIVVNQYRTKIAPGRLRPVSNSSRPNVPFLGLPRAAA
jgi:hypothetical protein